jgi:serine/threonine protein kinase
MAFYRGMKVVVKELKIVKVTNLETDNEAAKRTKEELIYEAKVINKLGDHPGLPLLFGMCSRSQPFKLVLQFHGEGNISLTISRAPYSRKIVNKQEWGDILKKAADALNHIHSVGFLHNDLKCNNIILDKRGNEYIPVIIDFGNFATQRTESFEDRGRAKKVQEEIPTHCPWNSRWQWRTNHFQ